MTAAQSHQHGRVFVLDGSNIAYRAFYALPDTICTSTGFPTNALYGFSMMAMKILADYRPEAVIVAWDSREKTFRHEEFEGYKAQRKPMPELLSEQWPLFAELGEAFGFINVAVPGYEADDIIATFSRQAEAEARELVIVTGDKDALQLVTEHVSVMANTKGVTEVRMYDPAAVEERFGVPPRLVPDLLGLKGDTSDNIPGVPGIGDKTAASLLAEFGSLEGVLEGLGRIKAEKRRELLREHADDARLSKKLALLDVDVPFDIHTAELAPHTIDRGRLREFFMRLEFTTLIDRLGEVGPPAAADVVAEGGDEESPALDVRRVDPHAMAAAIDWTAAAAVAAATGPDDRVTVWLAQGPDGGPGGEAPVDGGATFSGAAVELTLDPGQLGPLGELLRRGPRICHDLKRIRPFAGILDQVAHDTYLAGYLLAPGRRSYDLWDLASEAGIRGARREGPSAGAAEAVTALALAARQEVDLKALGMWRLFQDIELPLTHVLLDMERAGIHLDCYRLGEITAKIQDQMEGLEAGIHELAGGEFNLGSTQQLGQVLFERLGLPRQRKTKTGYSTDQKTLDALRGSHPIIERIETHRELSKLLSTYLLALPALVDERSRIHTTFHQTVAATGRLSSSDPNLQNIPVRTAIGAQIRECFTAEEGRRLVVADYSQIELRLMAHFSQEGTLLEAFANGEDVHLHTAAEVFDVPEEQVDATQRRNAKAVNFGIMYGISPFGLAQNLGIDQEVARAYIERYFARMPKVRAFIDATIADARTQGFVATVFGRRRAIPELHSDNFQTRSLGERLAVNSVIQGSAADIIKLAMIRVHERLAAEVPQARLVLQVHDELIVETPAADVSAVRDLVAREMVAAFPIDPPLVVDVGVGEDWLSAK